MSDNPTVKMSTPSAVPTEYQKLGATRGYQPAPPEDLRFWIIGPPGQGKSQFLMSTPDTIVLDYEQGANAVTHQRSVRVPIKDYEHHQQIINKLIEDGRSGRPPFKRVAFDTVDVLCDLIISEILEEKNVETIGEFGSRGAGYNLLKNRFWSQVRALSSAGYAWTVIGHIKYKTVTINKREVTKQTPVLYDSVASVIQRNADVFATIHKENQTTAEKKTVKVGNKTVETEGKPIIIPKYYMNLATMESQEAKARGVPTLSTKIELPEADGWQTFVKEYNRAVEEAEKAEKADEAEDDPKGEPKKK